jgi:hypothetical protein
MFFPLAAPPFIFIFTYKSLIDIHQNTHANTITPPEMCPLKTQQHNKHYQKIKIHSAHYYKQANLHKNSHINKDLTFTSPSTTRICPSLAFGI